MKRIFPLLLVIAMFSCGSDDSGISGGLVNNPASATVGTNTKEPKIVFEKLEHDFGKMLQGEKVSYTYKFKNEGSAPLLISSVDKTCGCTDTKFPKTPIKPGESGTITITYDSEGHKGFQNKRIIVKTNTTPSETILKFKAQVETADNF